MGETLADRVKQQDAQRFVGRRAELAFFGDVLVDDPPVSIVHVHGPGGIGKSTLLREVARLARQRGFVPLTVDGRELAPVPGDLEAVFTAACAEERPLVVFDTYERISALDPYVRQSLLPALPAGAVVLFASREPPAAGWFEDGWEHLVRSVALGPLEADERRELVRAHGVSDAATAEEIARWSEGSPLALAVGADVAATDGGWDGRALEERPELVGRLVSRLAGPQQEGEWADVTAVAAIARVTTAAMLADVLTSIDPLQAHAWLREQAITEPVGDGLAMHDLVRRATRAHLRAVRPERERELRKRIADHLFTRAAAGEPRLTVDLAELIDNPALRWGFGAEGALGMRLDAVRPGELALLTGAARARAAEDWWTRTAALIEAGPEHAVAARGTDDELLGLAIAFTPANASAASLADPYVGGWIAHARDHTDGNALIWRDSMDLTTSREGSLSSRVLAVVNTAAVLRSGLVNPRYFYLPINPINKVSVVFARESGAVHVPELDVDVGPLRHECHVVDYGVDGVLGSQRDRVYAELGYPREPAAVAVGPQRAPAPEVTSKDVHAALRSLDRPSELAVSPLAAVAGPGPPAEAVRALLVRGVEEAFGAGSDEELLRDIARKAYVDRRTSHEQGAHDLHVSRTTYFRRLRQVNDRVADFVLASLTFRAREA